MLEDPSRVGEPDEDGVIESLLVCAGSDDSRFALPLAAVSRLEEIEPARVECVGSTMVVQYRGELMHLLRLSDVLEERRRAPRRVARVPEAGEPLQVAVLASDGALVGLVFDRFLDIVAERVRLRPATRAGVLGCQVIQGRVTEFLDPGAIFRAAAGLARSERAMAGVA